MTDPLFKSATPEKLARALLKPVNRKTDKTNPSKRQSKGKMKNGVRS